VIAWTFRIVSVISIVTAKVGPKGNLDGSLIARKIAGQSESYKDMDWSYFAGGI
jgi:hypothetical protein